jgi:transcriptional regulator with XRE-family HTH domain
MARLVGVRPATYGRWEHGTAMPRLLHLPAMAKGLGMKLEQLMEMAGYG